MRFLLLSVWFAAVGLVMGLPAGANAAQKMTFADIAAAPKNQGQALGLFLSGTTRVFWERGGQVSIYYFASNGRLIRADSGKDKLLYGKWTLRKGRNPSVCLHLGAKGKKTCYTLKSKALKWEAGACEGNAFALSSKSGKAPSNVGIAARPKVLVKACQRLSERRLASVKGVSGITARMVAKSLKDKRYDSKVPGIYKRGSPERRRWTKKLTTNYAGTTRVTYSRGHGYQVVYFAPNKRVYLAHPKNPRVLPGKWWIQDGVWGHEACFNYGPNTYNPVTKRRKRVTCIELSTVAKMQKSGCVGDRFGLSRSKSNPFGPGQNGARRAASRQCQGVGTEIHEQFSREAREQRSKR